jgi:signal transduction histidine kinase
LSDPSIDSRNHKRITRIARAVNEIGENTAALLALAREKGDASSRSIECDAETVAREVIEHYQEIFEHKPVEVILDVRQPLMVTVNPAKFSTWPDSRSTGAVVVLS